MNKLKDDSTLFFYSSRELLQELHISNSLISLSCNGLSAFAGKFAKQRCVTYLAKDGLAPRHEEDESAIRQMLKKFHRIQNTGKLTKAQPSDVMRGDLRQNYVSNSVMQNLQFLLLAIKFLSKDIGTEISLEQEKLKKQNRI